MKSDLDVIVTCRDLDIILIKTLIIAIALLGGLSVRHFNKRLDALESAQPSTAQPEETPP